MHCTLLRSFAPFLLAVCAMPVLRAQCDRHWLPGDPRVLPAGEVESSVTWDPDGAGPLPQLLVIGGAMTVVAHAGVGVVTYDGTRWAAVGELAGPVLAVAVHNGQLHAAVGGAMPSVSVWTGSTWQSLGPVGGLVNALASYNGELVAAGQFASIGTLSASSIARWNGSAWASLATGVQGDVRALAIFGGSLYVGGAITSAGGIAAGNLARWNGSSWATGPTFSAPINAIAVRTAIAFGASFLFVGGQFVSLTHGATTVAAQKVARFDPAANTWSALGAGLPNTQVMALLARGIGTTGFELVAGVRPNTPSPQRMWRFDGVAWSPIGTISDFTSLLWPTTIAFHGGRYNVGLNQGYEAVRAWTGSFWETVDGGGIGGSVDAVEPAGNEVVIAGTIMDIDGVPMNHIARGSAGVWTSVGGGMPGGSAVLALATAPNGDLFAGGAFAVAGTNPASNVARWNGTAWTALGSGTNGFVHVLLALPSGDVIAGGDFTIAGGVAAARIAQWNGTTWSPVGGGTSGAVLALARLPDGSIVAGGSFTTAGGIAASCIARFAGGIWSPLGSGCNGAVRALAVAPNGDLHVGGGFTVAGGIPARLARWRNGLWSPTFAPGIDADVRALAVHPNGDLLVGGDEFELPPGPSGGWRSSLVRVVAGGGATIPEGVTGLTGGVVSDIAAVGADVVIGGSFDVAGPEVSSQVARLHVPCPAAASPYGAGCAGFALVALHAPWLGRWWHLRAFSFAPNAFGVRVVGLAPLSLPLSAVLPGALPGCMGLAAPDFLELLLPGGGVADIVSPVPVNPSLVGAQLREQVLQFEVLIGGLTIHASNGVLLTVGVL